MKLAKLLKTMVRKISTKKRRNIVKKVYILMCVILMVLLIGYNNKTVSTEGTNELDKIKPELQLIPQKYNTDNAVKDGYFVILNQEVKSKIEIIDKFVSDSQNQKPTSITIVQYTLEGEQIISKVVYDGIKYYAIEDDTRVTDSNTEYRESEFEYIKVFEENNHKTYVLVNDKEINYSQYIKSLVSSNSKDSIDHQVICGYNN